VLELVGTVKILGTRTKHTCTLVIILKFVGARYFSIASQSHVCLCVCLCVCILLKLNEGVLELAGVSKVLRANLPHRGMQLPGF